MMEHKCIGCLYLGEFRDMGATTPVCYRKENLGEAVEEVKKEGNCENKLTLKQCLERIEKLEKENQDLKIFVDSYANARDELLIRNQNLEKENQMLKTKADKYDELCSHNVMESQDFGDDLIQGILALNKRIIERNKKFIKVIGILKDLLNLSLCIGEYEPNSDRVPLLCTKNNDYILNDEEYELIKEVLG